MSREQAIANFKLQVKESRRRHKLSVSEYMACLVDFATGEAQKTLLKVTKNL